VRAAPLRRARAAAWLSVHAAQLPRKQALAAQALVAHMRAAVAAAQPRARNSGPPAAAVAARAASSSFDQPVDMPHATDAGALQAEQGAGAGGEQAKPKVQYRVACLLACTQRKGFALSLFRGVRRCTRGQG
jgi:hypothetical protein